MKHIIFCLSLLFSTLISFNATAEQETQIYSDAELAQMLAPIALYPDSLLTHILIASTYPIEVIESYRWLKKNSHLNTKQQSQRLKAFDWDASVKALIPFEHVLSRLSEELSWTKSLGDAFLQDEPRLLSTIQTLRKKAKRAGNLRKMDNLDVHYEDKNISILPREKEVVYVPYYDSRTIYGSWSWSAYPPVFWQPRHSFSVNYYHPFNWHSGVHITFNYFFSAFHWHNRHVVVVNPHHTHHRYYHQRPRRLVTNGGYAKRWSHQPSHRKGVAYRTKRTSEKYLSKKDAEHRFNKKRNISHHKVKQKLSTVKHSQHRAKHSQHKPKHSQHREKHSVNHKDKLKVRGGHVKSRQAPKQVRQHQKSRSTKANQHKKSRQPSLQKRIHKPHKRVVSGAKNAQHRGKRTSNPPI